MGPPVYPNNRIGGFYYELNIIYYILYIIIIIIIIFIFLYLYVSTGLQMCIDGIPAFATNTTPLKPLDFVNLSLPPGVRTKVENMLLMMLLPMDVKGKAMKKYFDFAATFELDDLFHNGMYHSPIQLPITCLLLEPCYHIHKPYRYRWCKSKGVWYLYGHAGTSRVAWHARLQGLHTLLCV